MSNTNLNERNIVHALMSGEISIEEFLEWCEENIPKWEKKEKKDEVD
jgi:hypothetical protein